MVVIHASIAGKDCTYINAGAQTNSVTTTHEELLDNTEGGHEIPLDERRRLSPTILNEGSRGTLSPQRTADIPQCSVGDLYRSRDAPSFFGSSYFGPQAAAKIIQAPAPDFSSGLPNKSIASSIHSFRDEGGPFSQIWDLLGILPRKKATVDRLKDAFVQELNWAIDAIEVKDFSNKYELFWSRTFGFDDLATIDLRWLALLFIVLAYAVLLDGKEPANKDIARDLQDTSLRFYWAARRAIVIAPTFYGESVDLVRAGVLVTWYLIYSRRISESWLTSSFAMRMAQAQGMHIDGERWGLCRQKTEVRRRVWSHLYTLDKTIALSIGRPFAIVDQQCIVKLASNLDLDDLDEAEAERAVERPLSEPTLNLGNRLGHELSVIVGKIQERCFGLFQVSYDTVLALHAEIVAWEDKLPPYFRLQEPDLSKDDQYKWLRWSRLRLHSMSHFAKVTLHRPFLLRQSITNRYRFSNDTCIASACADLEMRLKYFSQPLVDRMKWTLGPHNMFNSALILGIIIVRDPFSNRSQAILEDLEAYCELQRNDVWLNEFALAEVKICELCIKKTRQAIRGAARRMTANSSIPPSGGSSNSAIPLPDSLPALSTPSLHQTAAHQPIMDHVEGMEGGDPVNGARLRDPFFGMSMNAAAGFGSVKGATMWDDQNYAFPETVDLTHWEQVLDTIMQDHQI
ncbi:hypothetical protein PFICI_04248 [Pestalotiopsis fici W106-1]|uniref:Xylanolytic transcriptional activator regulatory domain-containing protein n=1 Tax=Pestalotiopsis fici (strain W106-1 / CGMCC3.15140) TaxID=1229662 RepID=W3XAD9_PESFW|nr:uncharacterized protein PFICI_04248 [Pestalotiopsis fici W106-1]ETS82372.1 hypothetical protein PFICI_04248 [Pestalotiopsis fici W106-1]